MSGWLLLLALLGAVAAGLYATGLRGSPLQLAVAALLLGSAGYALQGRPGLAGSPTAAGAAEPPLSLASARHSFFGQFTSGERWLLIADSFASRGQTDKAVGLLASAVRQRPKDATLWVGLGNALVDHAGGVVTPAAELAFRRAEELAPDHPGPLFFHGLALGRSGQRDAALARWRSALERAPPQAQWVPGLRQSIAQIEAQAP